MKLDTSAADIAQETAFGPRVVIRGGATPILPSDQLGAGLNHVQEVSEQSVYLTRVLIFP